MISFSSYAIYVVNGKVDEMRLCGKHFVPYFLKIAQKYLEKCQGKICEMFSENGAFAIIKYDKIKQNGNGYIGYDCNTGDGWLVAAESVSLIESGCKSVIIAHPFGCLVSHVCERGIVPALRRKYPNISIQAVEYDSGINEVRTTSRVLMGIGSHLDNDKKYNAKK